MKKPVAAILCIALLLVFGFKIFDKPSSAEIEYYTSINRMIKDQDFYTARVSEGEISLYDKNNIIIETMGFDFYDRSIPLVTIRKEFGNLYFVTAGSVDDEYGVVFMNDSANNLDGIMSLERIGGNAFLYSTRSKNAASNPYKKYLLPHRHKPTQDRASLICSPKIPEPNVVWGFFAMSPIRQPMSEREISCNLMTNGDKLET